MFRPKMGMNTKLWILKYAPNTAVAVGVKTKRILFMPKVITELDGLHDGWRGYPPGRVSLATMGSQRMFFRWM